MGIDSVFKAGEILKAISSIMGEVGAIEKKAYNAFSKFSYRGIEDVLATMNGLLSKHGVIPITVVKECDASSVLYKVFFVHSKDGSYVAPEVRINEKSGRTDPQGSGGLYSYAFKEACFKLFSIPVEQDDSDKAGGVPPKKAKARAKAKAEPKVTLPDWYSDFDAEKAPLPAIKATAERLVEELQMDKEHPELVKLRKIYLRRQAEEGDA